MNNFIYKIYECCKIIKGPNRAVVYDINRLCYFFISLEDYKCLLKVNEKTFDEVKALPLKEKNIIDFLEEYLDKEIIFKCPKNISDNFIKIPEKFETPFPVKTCCFIFNEEVLEFDILDYLNVLSENNIKTIIFYFKEQMSITNLQKIRKVIQSANFEEIQIVSNNIKGIKEDILDFVRPPFPLGHLSIYNSNKDEIIYINDLNVGFETKQNIDLRESNVDHGYFRVSTRVYVEAQSRNLFYNAKIFINNKGAIYYDLHLEDLAFENLSLLNFKSFENIYGKITKDKILVCKDCEFRYMCVDPRKPISIDGQFQHLTDCNYNPYTSKWINE